MKGIPVIQKQDVTVIRSMVWGTYAGLVCEALWTNNGVEVCCISGLKFKSRRPMTPYIPTYFM